MFGLFNKTKPALKTTRCCKATVYLKNTPEPVVYNAPDSKTTLYITDCMDTFMCVQVEHEDYELSCTLAAHAIDNVVLVNMEHVEVES